MKEINGMILKNGIESINHIQTHTQYSFNATTTTKKREDKRINDIKKVSSRYFFSTKQSKKISMPNNY